MSCTVPTCSDSWSANVQAISVCSPGRRRDAELPESSRDRLNPSVSFDLLSGRGSEEAASSSTGPNRTAAWVDSATASRQPTDADEEQQEDSQQDMLRRVFQAWRTAAANQHARRVHSNQNEVPLHESAHPASCIVHSAMHPALAHLCKFRLQLITPKTGSSVSRIMPSRQRESGAAAAAKRYKPLALA